MSDIILGIDPGTRFCGFSVIRKAKDKCFLIAYGLIDISSEKSIYTRMKKISYEISILLDKYSPDVLAIEDVFYHKNFKSTSKMLQFKGIIILKCLENKMKIFEYSPAHVKKSIVGDGRANKNKIMRFVKNFFNIENDFDRDDVSDAIAVALCYFRDCIVGGNSNGNKRQAIKKRKKRKGKGKTDKGGQSRFF